MAIHTLRGRGEATMGTVDEAEIERFQQLADRWWDPEGEFAPLHRINPARLLFIRETLSAHFARGARELRPFADLALIDVGCGGGLIAEPMARLGFAVTAIDADAAAIAVARAHAAESGLAIDYRAAAAEALAAAGETFDAVLALELAEHAQDQALLFSSLARLVKPGGALVVATLNRTLRAFALAIVGAEYVLHWLPQGTHRWQKFLRPSEVAAQLRHSRMTVRSVTGLGFSPLEGVWKLGGDPAVNYFLYAVKQK